MVALAPITNETPAWDVQDTFPKLHSRAREEKTTPCTEAPHSKSLVRVEIWQAIYETCDGLESFTRDPIGFAGSPFSLYEFLDSRGTSTTDPTGKQCCMHIWLPRGIFEVGHSALKCGSSYYSFWPSTGAGPLSPTDACSGNTEAGDEASEGRPADQKVCLDTCQLDEGAIAAKWNEMMQECRSGARTYCMYGANCATSVAGLINAGLVPGCDKCNPCQIFKGCTTPCDGSFRGGIPGIDDPVSLESYGKCLKKNGCKKSPICHDTPDGSVGSF
jgi:hypothetical protein